MSDVNQGVWDGLERRAAALTDAQIEAIAERAAAVALEKVYAQVGRSVVNKFLWLVGAAALALYAYLQGKGVS